MVSYSAAFVLEVSAHDIESNRGVLAKVRISVLKSHKLLEVCEWAKTEYYFNQRYPNYFVEWTTCWFLVLGRPPTYLIFCQFIKFKCVFDSWSCSTHFERFKLLTEVWKTSERIVKFHIFIKWIQSKATKLNLSLNSSL